MSLFDLFDLFGPYDILNPRESRGLLYLSRFSKGKLGDMMALFHGIAPTKMWVSPKAILQNMGMARTSGFEKWDGFAPEIARVRKCPQMLQHELGVDQQR